MPKKHKRKVKIIFRAIYGVLGILIIIFIIFWLFSMKKQLYISPVALSLKIISSDPVRLTIESRLKSYAISYTSVDIEKDQYIVFLLNEEKVLLDPRKSLDTQISSLQLLLSQLTIEGKHFKTLDFRYNKPIIVFK